MNTYPRSYNPYTANLRAFFISAVIFLRNIFVTLLVAVAFAISTGAAAYFYNEYKNVQVEMAEVKAQLQICETKRSQALIPETSWSEFGHNRFVVPVKNGYNNVKNFVVSMFSNE